MPGFEEIAHHAIERGVPHENLLLLPPHRDAELPQRQRTALAKDGESLPLSAGEAAVERRRITQQVEIQPRAQERFLSEVLSFVSIIARRHASRQIERW